MYVILVYDVNEKRVAKMLKLCRCYLNWVQNSVFEGHISAVQLQELMLRSQQLINPQEDSIIVFKSSRTQYLEKEIWGLEKMSTDRFL